MKSGKERQAEHTTRLKFLGLRQVAVWVSDTESWLVNQASAGAKADRLMTAHEYMGRLVDRSRKEMLDTFLADGGTMAVFEIERDGRRTTLDALLGGRFALLSLGAAPIDHDLATLEIAPDEDIDGRLAAWFATRGAVAAIVRPDRYLYATAPDAASLRAHLATLARTLAPHIKETTP